MLCDTILKILNEAPRALSFSQLKQKSGTDSAALKEELARLADEGRIYVQNSSRYAIPAKAGLIFCRVRLASYNSPAFAIPFEKGSDIYIDMPEERVLNGDLVFIRLTKNGDKPRGTLIQIVKRSQTRVTGTLYIDKKDVLGFRRHTRKKGRPRPQPQKRYIALLSDKKLPREADVVQIDCPSARPGDLCVFNILSYPYSSGGMKLALTDVLGSSDSIDARLSAICSENSIVQDFDAETLECARSFGNDPKAVDYDGRMDLRDDLIFTIDGDDAQDFDDAVSIEVKNDTTILGVHIADVSNYVMEGSVLDDCARQRGTSVYLPGLTIPMLPESLCNCLCSLMPERDRLTFSCIMRYTGLKLESFELRTSVIRSKARLTYSEVNKLFEGKTTKIPHSLHAALIQMNRFAKALRNERIKNGSIELDLPEPEFILDASGKPISVSARDRGDAEILIEEFMLAANTCVASFAQKNELPFPYRVHEKPDADKLSQLDELLIALGDPIKVGQSPSQTRLAQVLSAFDGDSRHQIVAEYLLRAMAKARYSEKNLGHYALAFKDYCHFTSPIRRYPDLLAHRMLKRFFVRPFTEEEKLRFTGNMHTLTEEASQCEQNAAQAERDADAFMEALYLNDHKRDTFSATITRILKHNAVVKLDNCSEGVLPYRNMTGGYSPDIDGTVLVSKNTNRPLYLGDRVTVRTSYADPAMGYVEFEMV
ncbi:MAG: VacB/RNase II family 3'-5' exoribonuclease [Clostridiales bacterium]|nr:VacB/RNase II family 3'-5' exoribonuclease [Clostridiales bacterium]